MSENSMQSLWASSYLNGGSVSYIEEMFENYLANPQSVDPVWKKFFDDLPQVNGMAATDVSHSEIKTYFAELAKTKKLRYETAGRATIENKQAEVSYLIDAYRSNGHLKAKIDPLGLMEPKNPPQLTMEFHHLTSSDLHVEYSGSEFAHLGVTKLAHIIETLEKVYCGTIGLEYMHINDEEQRAWLEQRFENLKTRDSVSKEEKIGILRGLIAAEGLEKYLGLRFVGQKRFSLEGGDALIPMLNTSIQRSGAEGVKEIVLGMAHRGRLNVLVNVLGKNPKNLFEEFEGKTSSQETSGDVKYHMGFSSDIATPGGGVHVALAFNPSHLEIISPVVEGSVRARQQRRKDLTGGKVLPIIIHGDAAFAGQGVVMETFNFSQTRGYWTGGTLHIIINNQIGFTTSNPKDARSTLYCSDVAKMVEAPIFHVNSDDPDAVNYVTQLALDFRMKFKKDVVIDLVCYRRHGHNEADEPMATQPVMYKVIRQHLTPATLYANQLIQQGLLTQADVDQMTQEYREALDAGRGLIDTSAGGMSNEYAVDWSPYVGSQWTTPADTRVKKEKLLQLANQMEAIPEEVVLQTQVAREMDMRRKMTAGEIPLNWGYAEILAYASLLAQGYPVRLSGQDCGRGTFSHRHAVLHNQSDDSTYIPLRHLENGKASFIVIDSVLSEEAVLGFEYGFATADPTSLVIWEAQFGDFANGAQVVIDQFISSGDQKWNRLCGLVMFLPHGYEGMGPEHSSARLERYLQLCAQHNMQVCVPTTPAQTFHMLRRQMIRPFRKPLIVMTPKSLLRHKLAVSTLEDLAEGQFNLVIPEIDDLKSDGVKRVVMCSGKVYYDLLTQRREKGQTDTAIIRIEQLYPFPEEELKPILASYKKAKEVVWCQEEPINQGAWYSMQHHMRACLAKGQEIRYAGRPASASPATGYKAKHDAEQMQLIKDALE